MTEEAYDTVRQEIAAYIDAMDEEEQIELVALAWVGRGDFAADEWEDALREARLRREGATSAYLLGAPLLAAHLENGLGEFGESCALFASDRQ